MRLNNTLIEFKKIKESEKGFLEYFYLTKNTEGETVGSCSLRIEQTKNSLFELGNIGYETDEAHRGRGHAKNAARMLLSEARALGLSRVTLCCREENEASIRIFRALGAKKIEKTVFGDKKILRFEKKLERIDI